MTAFETAYNQLNPEQKRAVDTIDGPVLVLAGPGTGKTQILSTRIANIIQKTDVEAHNILALTFTNSGAKNMQQRLVSLMGPAGYAVKCATFHSFCSDVIATHPEHFPALTSLSESAADVDRFEVVEDVLKQNNFPLLKPVDEPFRYVRQILSLLSNYKREGHDPLSLRQLAEAEISLVESGELKKREAQERRKTAERNLEIAQILTEYERLMRQRGLYDYDDIILWVRDALKNNEELSLEYQERFQYVLIDEFQDTNQAQMEVAQALVSYWGENANVFAVGDPNQSIYRFQGASLANTLGFLDHYPQAEVITLRTGYRCGQPIYDAAAAVIAHNALNLSDKRLHALYDPLKNVHSAPGELFVHTADNTLAECFWLAGRINELHEQGVPFNQIAVLYRQHKHVRLLESVLDKAGIAYEIDDGSSILDHPLILQVVTLLRLLCELQQASEAPEILPVLHQHWFALDPTDVLKVVRTARTAFTGKSPWEIIIDDDALDTLGLRDVERLRLVRDQLIAWQHQDGQMPVSTLIETILREAGVYAKVLDGKTPLVYLNALASFLREAQEWSRLNPQGRLTNWLDRLERMRRHGLGIPENDLDLRQESVRLSSAHKAKGQEWEHVFLLHAEDTYWGNQRSKNQLKPLPQTIPYAELDKNEHNEDERRLFYVALTRAKKSVTVCWSARSVESGRVREFQPTQFLAESAESPWQTLTGPESEVVRRQLTEYLTAEAQSWLPEQVDRNWIQSLLRHHFSLSPSALRDYQECPAKFLLGRVVRLPQPPQVRLAIGTAAHAALEYVYKRLRETGSVPPVPAVHQRMDEALAQLPFSESELAPVAAEAKSLMTEYLQAQSGSFSPALEVEKNIGRLPPVVFEGLPLNGKIDRVDLLNDVELTARVVDYKDTKPKSRNAILGRTQDKSDYFRQLTFYALLAELDETFPYHVTEGEIVFLRSKERGEYISEVFAIEPENLEELKALLREVKEGLETLSFLDKPACGRCDVCKHLGLAGSQLAAWAGTEASELFTASGETRKTAKTNHLELEEPSSAERTVRTSRPQRS